MAIRAWPASPARRKNVGRAKIVSPHRPAARTGRPASRIKLKKKLALVYINYFFYELLH